MNNKKNINTLNINNLEDINGGVGPHYRLAFPQVNENDSCDSFYSGFNNSNKYSNPHLCKYCNYFRYDDVNNNSVCTHQSK